VFLGHWSPHSAGDYATGANHVLPTGGLARAYGPLSVEDFGSWRQVQTLTKAGLAAIRATIGSIASAESLTAHRLSVDIRFEDSP
jgi:histidinol dehydrogenase